MRKKFAKAYNRRKFAKVYMIAIFVLFLSCFGLKFYMEYQSTYGLTTLEGNAQALDNIEIRGTRGYSGYESEFVIADGQVSVEHVATDGRYGIGQENALYAYREYMVCLSDQGNLEYEIAPTTDSEIDEVYIDSLGEVYDVFIHGDTMTAFLNVRIGDKRWLIDTEMEEPIQMEESFYRNTFRRDPRTTEVQSEEGTYQSPYENINWPKTSIAHEDTILEVELEYDGDTAYVFPLYKNYLATGGIYKLDISDLRTIENAYSPYFEMYGNRLDMFYEDLDDVVYKEMYEAEGEYEKINVIDLKGKTFYDMSIWKDCILLTYHLDGQLYMEQYDTDGQLIHTLYMPDPRVDEGEEYWQYQWIKGETTAILVISKIGNDYNEVQYYNIVVDEKFNKLQEVEGIGEHIDYAEIFDDRYVEITSSPKTLPMYPSFTQQGYVDASVQEYFIQVYEKTEEGRGNLEYKGKLDFQFNDVTAYQTASEMIGEYGNYIQYVWDWQIQEVDHD